MLSIHKTDMCIESHISSTEEEDGVPQRQRFVPEFDVTYLQHTARERSTPYLSNHLSIFHTAVPDLSYPSEMLLCTPFLFIFHKAYFSQLLIILQFAGESLFKYGFNKSSLLQANLITNSKGWPGTWLCGHFHRREKTEQWVVHSASCTQNCTNTAAVDFYVNWQQGQHCHF